MPVLRGRRNGEPREPFLRRKIEEEQEDVVNILSGLPVLPGAGTLPSQATVDPIFGSIPLGGRTADLPIISDTRDVDDGPVDLIGSAEQTFGVALTPLPTSAEIAANIRTGTAGAVSAGESAGVIADLLRNTVDPSDLPLQAPVEWGAGQAAWQVQRQRLIDARTARDTELATQEQATREAQAAKDAQAAREVEAAREAQVAAEKATQAAAEQAAREAELARQEQAAKEKTAREAQVAHEAELARQAAAQQAAQEAVRKSEQAAREQAAKEAQEQAAREAQEAKDAQAAREAQEASDAQQEADDLAAILAGEDTAIETVGDVLGAPTQEEPERRTDDHPIIDFVMGVIEDVITPGIDVGDIFNRPKPPKAEDEPEVDDVSDILTGVVITDEGLVDPDTTAEDKLVTIIPDVTIDTEPVIIDEPEDDVDLIPDILAGVGDEQIITDKPEVDIDLIPDILTGGGGDGDILEPTISPEGEKEEDLIPTIPPSELEKPEEEDVATIFEEFKEDPLKAILGGVSSAASSIINIKAAEDAAEFGLKGTQETIAFLERESARNRAQVEPFIKAGAEAERGTQTFTGPGVDLPPQLTFTPEGLPILPTGTGAGREQAVDIGADVSGIRGFQELDKGNLQEITLPSGEKINVPLNELQAITQGRTPGQLDPFDLENPLTKSLIEEALTKIDNLAAAQGRFGAGGTDVLRGRGVGEAILRGATEIEAVNLSRSQRRLAEEQQEFRQLFDVDASNFEQRRAFRKDLEGEDLQRFNLEAAKRGIIFDEDREITNSALQQRAQEFIEIVTKSELTNEQQLAFRKTLNAEEQQLFDIISAGREQLFEEQFAATGLTILEAQRFFENQFGIDAKAFQQQTGLSDRNFDELVKLLTIGANTAVGAGSNQVRLAESIAATTLGGAAIEGASALGRAGAITGGISGILEAIGV